MGRRFLFVLAAFTLALFSAGTVARRVNADSPFTIIDQSIESTYGQSFTFRITASSSAGNITGVRLFWKLRGAAEDMVGDINDFDSGPKINAQYVMNTKGRAALPPWQLLFYSWELTDDAGNVYQTPQTKAEVIDKTRDWQTLTAGKVAVYWHDQDKAFGQKLLAAAQQSYTHFASHLTYIPTEPLRIVVFNTPEDMCNGLPVGRCSQVRATVQPMLLFNGLSNLWLQDEKAALTDWLPRAVGAAYLSDWWGPNYTPEWFGWGLIIANQSEGLESRLQRARELARLNQLTGLADFDTRFDAAFFGGDSAAYEDLLDQAYSLSAFMVERFGLNSIDQILEKRVSGLSFEEAFNTGTGLTIAECELEWHKWLGMNEVTPTNPSK